MALTLYILLPDHEPKVLDGLGKGPLRGDVPIATTVRIRQNAMKSAVKSKRASFSTSQVKFNRSVKPIGEDVN